jgi:hypothetical protein
MLWYRAEWQGEMGTGRTTIALIDEGGGPEWHERFRALIVNARTDSDATSASSFPMRYYLQRLYRGRGTHNKRRATYLFRLACMGFDVAATARATSPAGWYEHGEAWAHDYTEMCLRRLYRIAHDPELSDNDGMPRKFLPRVGKSEAQHRAEEAA